MAFENAELERKVAPAAIGIIIIIALLAVSQSGVLSSVTDTV
jgi:hypothetical protein